MQQVPERHLGSPAPSGIEEFSRRYKLLLHATHLAAQRGFPDLLHELSQFLCELFDFNCLNYALRDEQTDLIQVSTLDEGLGGPDAGENPEHVACANRVWSHRESIVISDSEPAGRFRGALDFYAGRGFRSIAVLPMITARRCWGTLCLGSTKVVHYDEGVLYFLERIAGLVGLALESSLLDDVPALASRLEKPSIKLHRDIQGGFDLREIVGESRALAMVLDEVKTVAPTGTTVLILGETGTGKELVARAIHKLSPRGKGNFVKLNCAAIPTGLLESELFGHEKGAFTGAISQKIGRLELAHKGTLFLDEIGEIPLELQPKLLRVLQDQEFERLGGTRTIRVDARILAATNRDVSKAVADHEFRSDLYYRLHVFPVRLPALRERPEDIPILVHYFVQKFASRTHKQIETIPGETMRALQQWHWPGNVRELESFVERSVILTDGPRLRVPLSELGAMFEPTASETDSTKPARRASQRTLEELERAYIVQVLRQTGGLVSGSRGAAARLGMKRTTLQSKMLRLEIAREEYTS